MQGSMILQRKRLTGSSLIIQLKYIKPVSYTHLFCAVSGISAEEITAFGDDYVDIGMLKLCGLGIAMGNAIDEVKEAADRVIGDNEEDGIAEFLEENFTG